MLTDGFLAKALKTLNEEEELLREWISSGKAHTIEDYRFATGNLKGILRCKEILDISYREFFEN